MADNWGTWLCQKWMADWMGKEEGEQLQEILGLVGERLEVLARPVGEGA